VQELPPDPLELPTDREFAPVEVHVIPGEAKHFTFANPSTRTRTYAA